MWLLCCQQILETQIQEAFLRFMACIMRGYDEHLLPAQAPSRQATYLTSLFDFESFRRSRDKASRPLFAQMLDTQHFCRFIEERSFVSDKDVSLAFFDDCTRRVSDVSDEPRLLEMEDTLASSERTVFIPPPDVTGLPAGQRYRLVCGVLLKLT